MAVSYESLEVMAAPSKDHGRNFETAMADNVRSLEESIEYYGRACYKKSLEVLQ